MVTVTERERTDAVQAHLRLLGEQIEEGLRTLPLPDEPTELYAPIRYVLNGGGKRMRPVLLLLAAEAYGGTEARARALPAALAVEVFHNFTLVHDDIMDAAPERRGRPTVHIRWDDATAILSGDLLMGLSYDLFAQVETDRTVEVIRTFHRMVARLCEGQALDTAFETRNDVSVPDYLDMIARKTGALVEAVLDLGGLIGGADEAAREHLRTAGHELGRAFQIQDDLLDLTADNEGWGKAIGGDLVVGKKTFLLLRALERAEGDEHCWFTRILADGGLAPEEVPEARERMERLGVLDEAREAVRRHSDAGLAALNTLPAGPSAEALRELAEQLARRIR